jgi:hypothetical protein
MHEDEIPAQSDPLPEGERPIPPVDEGWALMRAQLDVRLPVAPRHWYGHWSKWAWVGTAAVTTVVTVWLVARRHGGGRAPVSVTAHSQRVTESGDAPAAGHDKSTTAADSSGVARGIIGNPGGATEKSRDAGAGRNERTDGHPQVAASSDQRTQTNSHPQRDANHRIHGIVSGQQQSDGQQGDRQQAQVRNKPKGTDRSRSAEVSNTSSPRPGRGGTDRSLAAIAQGRQTRNENPVNLATTTTTPGTGWRRMADSSLQVAALGRPKPKDSTIGKKAAGKGKNGRGSEGPMLAAGLAAGKVFPIGGQSANNYGSNGKVNALGDYLPSLYIDYYPTRNLYLEVRLAYHSPQYTHSQVIDSSGGDSSHLPGWQSYFQFNSNTLKKLFYNDLGVSLHYRVFDHLWLGAGLQLSLLSGGAAYTQLVMRPNFPGGVDTTFAGNVFALKDSSSVYGKLKKTELRGFVELDYTWRRWALGLRFQQAFQSYLPTLPNGTSNPYRNASWGIHLRYDLWRSHSTTLIPKPK